MPFEPIKESELRVGQAVPWSLYDRDRRLLLARGSIIESERQVAQLALRGLFRKLDIRPQTETRTEDKPDHAAATREELRALDEIKLGIGDTLHLQSQSDTSPVRYSVKLIGYLRGKGIIVSTPTQDGKVLLMRDGQSFVVRLFSGKSVYAFPTTIFKVANVPYPHLHLTWPSQVTGVVGRGAPRARVNLIAAITDAKGRTGAATLDNLSTGGCALFSKSPLGNREERIRIKFRVVVSEVEQYLDIEGIIRSVQRDIEAGDNQPVQHGIQFVDLPPNDQLVLTAYVYHTLFEESAET
jgi:c-di-GMP-binding flagellar brake protein YcgR